MSDRAPTIILGVCGSIAAYKAADLASKIAKRGCDLHVVMTKDATQFVGTVTFQTLSRNLVTTDVFDEKESLRPGHIDLADRASLLLIAPATANIIAKLACGIADDALTSIALATLAPLLIAPAMNGKMWKHPATQENVARLIQRGVQFIGPEEGMLACGYEGIGRLWEVEHILVKAEEMWASANKNGAAPKSFPKKKSSAKEKNSLTDLTNLIIHMMQ